MTAKRGLLLGASIKGRTWSADLLHKDDALDFTQVLLNTSRRLLRRRASGAHASNTVPSTTGDGDASAGGRSGVTR